MSYIKKTWETGQIITATDMNHIEDGILNIDTQINSTNGISITLNNINDQINGNGGISSQITTLNGQISTINDRLDDVEDNIDSIENSILNGVRFGGINFSSVDVPTTGYPSVEIGEVRYIQENNGSYYILPDDDSMKVYIWCYKNVTSEFYGGNIIPPTNTHIFMAFVPSNTVYDSGTLSFSGEMSTTPTTIIVPAEGDDGSDSTSTGYIMNGIGNILFTYTAQQNSEL